MRSSDDAPEFSDPIRSMQQPRLVRRLEVAAAEFERSCDCAKEEDEEGSKGEMRETHVPIYKGANTRHAWESRRPKSSCGYMDASIFEMFIKIRSS